LTFASDLESMASPRAHALANLFRADALFELGMPNPTQSNVPVEFDQLPLFMQDVFSGSRSPALADSLNSELLRLPMLPNVYRSRLTLSRPQRTAHRLMRTELLLNSLALPSGAAHATWPCGLGCAATTIASCAPWRARARRIRNAPNREAGRARGVLGQTVGIIVCRFTAALVLSPGLTAVVPEAPQRCGA
jgi:hypothetical protein